MQMPASFSGTTIDTYINLAKNLFEAAYIIDKEGTVLYWNATAHEITGYDYYSIVGKKCKEMPLLHFDTSGQLCHTENCPMERILATHTVYASISLIHNKNGYILPVDMRCIPLTDTQNNIVGLLEIFKRQQDPSHALKNSIVHGLVQTAYIDNITNLPNKQYMEQKIKNLLSASVKSSKELSLSLLIIDIRNLADFNSYGGLTLGNLLLKTVAKTLLENIEIDNGHFAARWYGGSFIVFINTNRKPTLLNWANKLKGSLDQTTVPEWEDIPLDVSIYGTIVQNNETFNEIAKRLEKQWSTCKEQQLAISIS